MDAWIAFAKTGNPNHDNMPQWQPYNLKTRPTMIFDAKGEEATSFLDKDPNGKIRAFWEGTAFDGLDPLRLPQDLSPINSLIPN